MWVISPRRRGRVLSGSTSAQTAGVCPTALAGFKVDRSTIVTTAPQPASNSADTSAPQPPSPTAAIPVAVPPGDQPMKTRDAIEKTIAIISFFDIQTGVYSRLEYERITARRKGQIEALRWVLRPDEEQQAEYPTKDYCICRGLPPKPDCPVCSARRECNLDR